MKLLIPCCTTLLLGLSLYSCTPRQKPAVSTEPTPAPAPAPEPPPAPPKPTPAKPAPEIPVNVLSAAEKSAGWQLLFDGASTDGWHAYGSKTIGTAWKAVDGTLHLDTRPDGAPKTGGDIVSDKEYRNFELQLDWKIDKAGNSGVCIFINENKDKYKWMWYTAPEIQIVDNEGHPDGKVFKHQAGDLYDLIPAKVKAANAPLEWNHYRIKCVNGKLEVYLNKQLVISTQLWDDAWKQLVANSKFKNLSDFAAYRSGRIGLQDHGNNVWFRNIKIREL